MDPPEDTQPLDTQVWEALGYSRAGPDTCHTNDTGHVNLLPAGPKPAVGSQTTLPDREELEDAIDQDQPTVTQMNQPETVTSPAAFSPTTPGVFAGARSMRPVNLTSSSSRTPAPNLAGMFKATGNVMGLTQLFDQTQARSSPGPGETSLDDILERPSPTFHDPNRAFSSSPIAVRAVPFSKSKSGIIASTAGPVGPKDHYISLKESQELRARRKAQQNLTSSSESEEVEESLDDPERQRAEKRRRHAARQERIRQEMRNVAIPMPSARKRRKLESAATVIGIITPASRRENYIDLMSDMPTDALRAPASSEDENDYFDELSQEVIPRSSPRAHTKTPATSKRSLQQVPISSTTDTMQFALGSGHHKTSYIQITSDTGRQVVATQPDRPASPTGSPAHASQSEKIADSQPTRDGESHSVGPTMSRLSPKSQPHSPFLEATSLSSVMQGPLTITTTTGQVQTSSAGPGPPKDSESEDDSHSAGLSQNSSQPTELPSSPPPTDPALSSQRRSEVEGSGNKVTSPKSTPSGLPNKRTASSGPDLVRPNQSSEPSQTFRVPNRLNYAVPDTSPAVPTPAAHDISSVPESLPPRRRTRSTHATGTSLSQEHSTDTDFETAREAQLLSPSKAQSGQPSTRSSARNSQAAKIRSMGDFETADGPGHVNGSLDIGFDVMNEDDVDFTISTSTPRKRSSRRLYRSKKTPRTHDVAQDGSNLELQDVQPPPSPAIEPERRIEADDDIFETSTPVTTVKKKPIGSLKRVKGPTVKAVPSTRKADAPAKPTLPDTSPEAAQPEIYSVPESDAGPTNLNARIAADAEQPSSHANETSLEATEKIVPYRVYAAFKGEYDYYYPGTCIGVTGSRGNQSYQVKFDDGGDVIAKHNSVIRRLELRVGDQVKVSIKCSGNSTWTIRGFSDQVTARDLSRTADAPHTDVYGHANVVLEAVRKTRAKSKSAQRVEKSHIETVPVELTYITHDLWQQFDDRLFHIGVHGAPDTARAGSHPQTPSIASLPPSPSTRKRRHTNAAAEKTTIGENNGAVHQVEQATGMFSNMAFAISYSAEADKTTITRLILQNGGTILKSGFDELFDTPKSSDLNDRSSARDTEAAAVESLRLTASASNLGFVALVADKHSRREKYIQALALNIPCLHGRWISDSIAAASVLPWAQYLLPAGESAYFGNAVRNRVMPPMPDATECRLSEIVAVRPAFLQSTNVLLIMGKGKAQERRRTHLFLTYALGAKTVLRVHDVDAAKAALQDSRETWDWVYVEEVAKEAVKTELLGIATAAVVESGRRRSKGKTATGRRQSARKSTGDASAAGPLADAKFKVVGDEFVIQSLIWGALVPGQS